MGSSESRERSRSEDDKNNNGAEIAIAAVVAVASIVSLIASGSAGPERKTMKAPGRNYRIFRDDFEKSPASYFRNLRK